MQPNTRVVFTESPGSLTFEVQDVPAIAAAAHRHGALVLLDNTWSAGLFFKPFDHGVDVSIQAATKYVAGHSDAVIGIITARSEDLFRRLKDTTMAFGDVAAPDTSYLALRGLRSMAARLRQQQAAGLHVAAWLRTRPEVKRVLYPALPDAPDTPWQRDRRAAWRRPARRRSRRRPHGDAYRDRRQLGRLREPRHPAYPALPPVRTRLRTTRAGGAGGWLIWTGGCDNLC